jgi:hypothetical protein
MLTVIRFLACLILNWKEDGIVYESRMDKYKSKATEIPPSLSLNKYIRGLRLLFVLLFILWDVLTIANPVSA